MKLNHDIEMFEVVSGAHAFWTKDEEGHPVIIDTGMPGNEENILGPIRCAGHKDKEVKYILITHADIDHTGSAAALKKRTGAKIAIHEAEREKVRGERDLKTVGGIIGPFFRLFMRFIKFTPFEPDILLKDGDEIAGFTVVHTPGHTEGSITLYKKGKVVIVGDAMTSTRGGRAKGPMAPLTLNMKQAQESIKKIASLDFDTLLCGHGAPVTDTAQEQVKKTAGL